MNKKLKRNFSFLTISLFTLIHFFLIGFWVFDFNKKNQNLETNNTQEDDLYYYLAWPELIPNEMWETPEGLYYYTDQFNKYLRDNPNYYLENDAVPTPTYLDTLIEREYEGWFLVDEFWNFEIVEEYLIDFLVWSYNERLNYDEPENLPLLPAAWLYNYYAIDTPEITENDVRFYFKTDGSESSFTLFGSHEDSLWDGSIKIRFDDEDRENSTPIGEWSTYLGIPGWNGVAIFYEGYYLKDRMEMPSYKQSLNIYDYYTQEEIESWFYNEFDTGTAGSLHDLEHFESKVEEEFYSQINSLFISKYGENELNHIRTIEEIDDEDIDDDNWYKDYAIYDVEDIRKKDYEISYYDENGTEYDTYLPGDGSNSIGNFEEINIKIEFVNNTYYFSKNYPNLTYQSSDYIDISTIPYKNNEVSYIISLNVDEVWNLTTIPPTSTPSNDFNIILLITLIIVIFVFMLLFTTFLFAFKRK